MSTTIATNPAGHKDIFVVYHLQFTDLYNQLSADEKAKIQKAIDAFTDNLGWELIERLKYVTHSNTILGIFKVKPGTLEQFVFESDALLEELGYRKFASTKIDIAVREMR